MPYIPQENRYELEESRDARNGGEVNYLVFNWLLKHFTNYDSINAMAAVIEGSIVSLKMTKDFPQFDENDEYGISFKKEVIKRLDFPFLTDDDIIGALRNSYLEFYIRYVRPYEDKAIERNGDIEV